MALAAAGLSMSNTSANRHAALDDLLNSTEPMSNAAHHLYTNLSLAAELGVSRTTVSNAYNRPDQLAPATRERILTAAAAHGYTGPDPTARSSEDSLPSGGR